jgi:hypothetical protein
VVPKVKFDQWKRSCFFAELWLADTLAARKDRAAFWGLDGGDSATIGGELGSQRVNIVVDFP